MFLYGGPQLKLHFLPWVAQMVKNVPAAAAAAAKSLQSCPTLCYPRDDSPPGSPVPGILQARTLEWVAISFSNAGNPGLIPGSRKAPVEGNGNPLQYPYLENPMDRGAWWATVHGVAQSRTSLCIHHFHFLSPFFFFWIYRNFLFQVNFVCLFFI